MTFSDRQVLPKSNKNGNGTVKLDSKEVNQKCSAQTAVTKCLWKYTHWRVILIVAADGF